MSRPPPRPLALEEEDEAGGHGSSADADAPAPPAELLVSDSKLTALIFSHGTTVDWLKEALIAHGFGYRFILWSMPLKQRAKVGGHQQDGARIGLGILPCLLQ